VSPSQNVKIKTQYQRAGSEVFTKVIHLALPWGVWFAYTCLGIMLKVGFSSSRWAVVVLTVVAGSIIAGLDFHLRQHRGTVVGRTIGPVTVLSSVAMLAAFMVMRTSPVLFLVYFTGGITACSGWDLWMSSAHIDLARAFEGATEGAVGGKARLFGIRREGKRAAPVTGSSRRSASQPAQPRSRASRAGRTTTATVKLPPEVITGDLAENAEKVEAGLGMAPGSFSVRRHPDNAGWSKVGFSDPRALDVPEPWPGPSAPGKDMSYPFRMGRWQNGQVMELDRLPLFHTRAMGMTGSAKTMGWSYNQLAEGVSRDGYAAFAMDVTKGEQFFGAWRPALHRFETEEMRTLYLLRAFHRARRARSDYLGRKHITEWAPGCGLSFLDIFMAEAPDIIRLLETAKTRMASAVMSLPDWLSDVKAGRSAGEDWNLDLQLSLSTELPSVSRGQMAHLCLGTESKEDSAFGLSSRQKEAGCRPELWGKSKPGMAFWDAPTLPDEYRVMPLRFFHWTGGAAQAFEYAQQWPASARPLDDVTGEALEAEPAPAASLALPGPGGTVIGLAGRPPVGRPAGPAGSPPVRRPEPDEARKVLIAFFERAAAAGQPKVAIRDLLKDPKVKAVTRSRTWLYDEMKDLSTIGVLTLTDMAPYRRWILTPPQEAAPPSLSVVPDLDEAEEE
jgi:hypothetical protein